MLRPIPVGVPRPQGIGAALASLSRRPTLWAEVGVALAWTAMVVGASVVHPGSASGSGTPWSSGGSLWICMTGMGGTGAGSAAHTIPLTLSGGPTSLAATFPMLALMAVATMLPPAMPAVRHVAVNSLYWRRRRATVEFLLVFVGIWVAFDLVVLGALSRWGWGASPAAAAAALAVAAIWQLTPLKRRAMLACHRARPLPPHGWRATAGVADFGLRHGGACLGSCWAMMLTTAFVGLPRFAWMAVLTTLITVERLNLKPKRTARRVGAMLGAAAVVAAVFALV